jgi:hypothetical protein
MKISAKTNDRMAHMASEEVSQDDEDEKERQKKNS